MAKMNGWHTVWPSCRLVTEVARLKSVRQLKLRRLYLTRPQLLPSPRIHTPWQLLRASRNDRTYITTMGFDVATFDLIVALGFKHSWYTTPIPRNDMAPVGSSRPSRRSLDAKRALGLVLHYFNSTMRDISLQGIFALIPTSVSRHITFGFQFILQILRTLSDAPIHWPKHSANEGDLEFVIFNRLIITRHPRLTGAFESLDGLKLLVQTSMDQDIENATYNSWLSEHFISSVLFFILKVSNLFDICTI
jgi:hypothetical protein